MRPLSKPVALLTSTSSASFMTEHLAQSLSLPCSPQSTRISGVAGLTHKYLAPIWMDLDFLNYGLLYYRVSQDSATLERVRDMIVQQNPTTLSAYQPTLAVIATWSEAQPVTHFSFSAVSYTTKKFSTTAIIVPRVTCDLPTQTIPIGSDCLGCGWLVQTLLNLENLHSPRS